MEKEQKEIIADLHIHSRFSRACSKNITIENLVKWARVKGLGLLGTGDFTHPKWLSEIKEKLVDKNKNGIYYYKDKLVISDKSEEKGEFPFILSSEISLVYSQNGKGHRVHLVYLAPNLEAVDKINLWLDSLGRRDYDGRPIFKISCRDFVAKMQEIDNWIEVIPAHIWTSWFGVFGSKSGFNSLEEAFGDMTKHIHAIETGLSSSPEMNWKIKDLENISLVSFSDSHSFWPWRLGREATIFILNGEELTYNFVIDQIRNKKFKATIEVNPEYGIYHYDGHKDCKFSCSPQKTKELNSICPVCNKPLTIGVENRVEELADKERWFMPQYAKPFYKILPLHEVIALSIGSSVSSKPTWKIYDELIKHFGTELNILLNVKIDELTKVNKNELFIELLMKNRVGNIRVQPGFDGQYGIPILPGSVEIQRKLV